MMRYLKISFLSLLVVGFMTGSAFAAAGLNAGNTTVAAERVPAATDYLIAAVNTAYQTGGPVAATTQIKITLANGNFLPATDVSICDGLVAGSYGTGPTAAGPPNPTSVTIALTKPLSASQVYTLQPVAAGACAIGAPTALSNVNIAMGSLAPAVLTMTVDSATSPGDVNVYATANVVTLVNQFSIEWTPVTDTITFTSAMKNFSSPPAKAVGSSGFAFYILSNETIADRVPTGLAAANNACAAMGGAGAKTFKFTSTPGSGFDFDGVTRFEYTIGVAPLPGTLIKAPVAKTDPSLAGNVDALGALLMACGSGSTGATKALPANQNWLVLTVNGTTVLTARNYSIKADLISGGGIGAGDRNLVATATGWTWRLDSTQYYIPLVGSVPASGRETYIKLQSKSTVAGSNGVSVAILASDGTIVATYNPGNITSGVPMTITGAALVAAATAAGKTVDGGAGFAVIVTVNAPAADLFGYANMIDAAGAKRIPMKVVGGTISE
jgi:hypothetical protein